MVLLTSFGAEQESSLDGGLCTDWTQSSGFDPDQIKQTLSGPVAPFDDFNQMKQKSAIFFFFLKENLKSFKPKRWGADQKNVWQLGVICGSNKAEVCQFSNSMTTSA